MTTNKYLYIILICISSLIYTSCSKSFLDNPDRSTLIRDEYIVNLDGYQQYLNGIYIRLSDSYSFVQTIYPEIIADNLKSVPGKTYFPNCYNWTQQATNENGEQFTTRSVNTNGISINGYALIRACNFVINNIDKFREENPPQSDNLKGQAYLIRAITYFQLVNIYAQSYNYTPGGTHPGVAYIKTDDWTDAVKGRQSVAEVYQEMIQDVQNAYQLLPQTAISTLCPSKTTAQAILSRLYLFKEDYTASKNQALETLKKTGLLSIQMGYPDNVYKLLPQAQTETLFQLPPLKFIVSGIPNYAGIYLGRYLRIPSYVATIDIANLLTANSNDVRSKWITTPGNGNKMVTKFPIDIVGTGDESWQYYQCVIRSSEVCLNAAESYARLNMEDSARYYLHLLRSRADVQAKPISVGGSALLDSIKQERRKELSFEGFRMFDLQRWKQSVNRTDPSMPDAKTLPYPSDKAISPLPLLDVKLYGLSQNPSY